GCALAVLERYKAGGARKARDKIAASIMRDASPKLVAVGFRLRGVELGEIVTTTPTGGTGGVGGGCGPVRRPAAPPVPAPRDPPGAGLAEVMQLLERRESVNVIVQEDVRQRAVGEELIRQVGGLILIDFEDPVTASRPGLLAALLRAFRVTAPVPDRKPDDLV